MSEVGQLLAGRYRLRRRLGSGAMGVVWKAVDERLGRPVAVKQLLRQPGSDAVQAEEARQRAMREARIAAKLRHPHVIAVHDVDEHDGSPLLVMEYFPGRSLADVLTEGPLTPIEVADIGAQAASALAAAHEAGIVHRDVKPGNLLLGDDGTVKITDFGISRATGDVTVTQTGVLAGTPAYLAPEIAQGKPPTAASDVFSLGTTLYAAVEDALPFGEGEENPIAVLHQVAAGVLPPPRQAGPLAPVLTAMLAVDPAARPTGAEAAQALRAVAKGEEPMLAPAAAALVGAGAPDAATDPMASTSAPTMTVRPAPGGSGTRLDLRPLGDLTPEQPATPAASPRPRRRWWLAAAGALVALVLAGIALANWTGDNDTPTGTTTGPPAPTTRALTAGDLQKVVSAFYAALPEHPDRAWTHLAPTLRAQGKDRFDGYWAGVDAVEIISAPRATGQGTVHAGVTLTMADGTTVTEFHQFGVADIDGTPRLVTDTILHSQTTAPAPPPLPAEDDRGDDDKDEGDDEKADEDRKGEEDKKGEKEKKGHGDGG
ncbi:hypothetical protein BAY59_33330 [Prauserella coralliicola]|nr:hypothetical protein BAY59_33330 [Prauserella coralliicola]